MSSENIISNNLLTKRRNLKVEQDLIRKRQKRKRKNHIDLRKVNLVHFRRMLKMIILLLKERIQNVKTCKQFRDQANQCNPPPNVNTTLNHNNLTTLS
jgi:hypothetical protein